MPFALAVKGLALLVGLALSTVSLMAVVGVATDNGWVRLLVGLMISVGAAAFAADRALPKEPGRSPGLASDVAALVLLALPLLVMGALGRWTKPLLVTEGDRLTASGYAAAARVAYAFGGVHVVEAAPPAAAGPSSASAAPAGAPPASSAAPATSGSSAHVAPAPVDFDVAAEHTPAEVFKAWAPSTVCIAARSRTGEGGGTGFVIDAHGTVATNHHVIEGAEQVRVKLFDGTWIDDVELLAENAEDDTALLAVKGDRALRPVPLGDSDKVTVGEHILAIGNPLGLEYTLTDGLVSSRRVLEGKPMIQMSVPVSPGNSGGPVFNAHGEAIGIATLQFAHPLLRAQNLNMATPINVLKRLVKDDYPGRKPYRRAAGGSGSW